MQYTRYILLLLLIMGGGSQALAQKETVFAAIQEMNQRYEQLENYHLQVNYSWYSTWYSGTVGATSKGEMSRVGEQYRSRVGDSETIQTKKDRIEIDHLNQSVYYLPNAHKKLPQMAGLELEQAMALCTKAETATNAAGKTCYRLFFQEGMPFARIDVYLNPQSGLLEQLALFYAQAQQFGDVALDDPGTKPRLEIRYTQHAEATTGPISVDPVLRFEKKVPQLQPKYKNYELIRLG